MSVSKEQLPYILSIPIHKNQKIGENRDDEIGVITIEVKPNFELMQLLLFFGELVIVMTPKHLKEEIFGKIKKNHENYKKVHID